MSVARFIADQRTFYRVPVAVCCAILGLSAGWFYKWVKAPVTAQTRRRRELDAKVRALFERLRAHLRLAADPPRPARGRLGRGCEHRRRVDATPRAVRPQTQAA